MRQLFGDEVSGDSFERHGTAFYRRQRCSVRNLSETRVCEKTPQSETFDCTEAGATLIPCIRVKLVTMNLTITVDDEVLKCARIRALKENTSVNMVLRDYLETYAGVRRQRREAVDDLLRLSAESRARRGVARWTRDELHER